MAYPLDADLNLPKERYSLSVRRRVAKEVVRGSFDEAVATVQEATGAHLPKREAEELTTRAAADRSSRLSTACLVVSAAAAAPPGASPPKLIAPKPQFEKLD